MTDKRMTDEELSRAMAEKLDRFQHQIVTTETSSVRGKYPAPFATDWSLIGPEIEKRYDSHKFRRRLSRFRLNHYETLPRAACLAILEERNG